MSASVPLLLRCVHLMRARGLVGDGNEDTCTHTHTHTHTYINSLQEEGYIPRHYRERKHLQIILSLPVCVCVLVCVCVCVRAYVCEYLICLSKSEPLPYPQLMALIDTEVQILKCVYR